MDVLEKINHIKVLGIVFTISPETLKMLKFFTIRWWLQKTDYYEIYFDNDLVNGDLQVLKY